MTLLPLLSWLLAHVTTINAVLNSAAGIVASASVLANVVKQPKAGTALDKAHTVLLTAALDFSKFVSKLPKPVDAAKLNQ